MKSQDKLEALIYDILLRNAHEELRALAPQIVGVHCLRELRNYHLCVQTLKNVMEPGAEVRAGTCELETKKKHINFK